MNCEQVKELQIRYLAGELTPEERREFVEHVTCCSACERMFSETENVWNLVKDACTASGQIKYCLKQDEKRLIVFFMHRMLFILMSQNVFLNRNLKLSGKEKLFFRLQPPSLSVPLPDSAGFRNLWKKTGYRRFR